MKNSIALLGLMALNASTVLACDTFLGTGTFVSTDANIGRRVITISQNGCDVTIQLNNAGNLVDPDILKVDGVAYDRSASSNFNATGEVIDPFRLASLQGNGQIRATILNGALVVSELRADDPATLSSCKEAPVQQSTCSFTQRVYTVNDNRLLETQNGYIISEGNNQPILIHYARQ